MTRCPDCNQAVLWVTSLKGKRFSLDANPSWGAETGFFIGWASDENGQSIRLAISKSWLKDDKLPAIDKGGLRFHRNHILTCPVRREQRERLRAAA